MSTELELARALVRQLEAKETQPSLQERLARIFLDGQRNIDRIVSDSCNRLDRLKEEFNPQPFSGIAIMTKQREKQMADAQRNALEQMASYQYEQMRNNIIRGTPLFQAGQMMNRLDALDRGLSPMLGLLPPAHNPFTMAQSR